MKLWWCEILVKMNDPNSQPNNLHFSYLPFFSILANNIPPIAVLACCTSFNSSAATALCFSRELANGDSKMGSIGSKGLIRCTSTHNFGSDTSRTLNGLCGLDVSSLAVGGGTGIPAGRNLSTLCTGIIKQSRSKVARDIGSDLAVPPPKLTESRIFV